MEHGDPSRAYDEQSLLPERSLVIIDSRALDGQCLAQTINAHKLDMRVLAFGSIEEWRQREKEHPPLAAVVLNVGGRRIVEPTVAGEIRSLSAEFEPTPIIVLADTDDLAQIMKALEYGAKGYIPSSVSIDVCVEAISLALAGGIFVPASSVFAMRRVLETGSTATRPLDGVFTARQAEVVEALRRGKANKIIAYELNLRESTVKVHIRNIMKKVKATNRTEVAYKINDLFGDSSAASISRSEF
ncbi:response regulator transcription factor [Sinorhizobium numidicum]|uniref:Response regulator transcription factor n=1 Tax=Sinorhizobium numidicum TaxID=680248 RepID=A0ABY8CWR9_9HYPH|nr:response regulator transcription factor [Sinorhizobium numidicum]WEX75756.1 response regulator transcription factor [Sinorhizobium numidicum]WEX81743.1 response regulator transcription factor [Sinorhizobium numidicum]